MANSSLIVSVSAAFLLAGCALGAGIETTSPAALPASAATYRLIGAEPTTAVDAAVASALRRQMGANGWRETAEDPVWQVEAAYAAAAEGARQSRSAKQQLDHWARVGRAVSSQHTAARRRVEAALAGDPGARTPLIRLALTEAALFGVTFGIAVGLGRTPPPPEPRRRCLL